MHTQQLTATYARKAWLNAGVISKGYNKDVSIKTDSIHVKNKEALRRMNIQRP